jgi:hypothetical protein
MKSECPGTRIIENMSYYILPDGKKNTFLVKAAAKNWLMSLG